MLMRLTENEEKVLSDVATSLKRDFAAIAVTLYGSAARGEMDQFSDLDLFVVLPRVDWEIEKKIGALCFDAGLDLGRVVSTLCVSQNELQNTPLRSDPLVLNVQREGKSL
jgi:predicted nucleotidyltransferase